MRPYATFSLINHYAMRRLNLPNRLGSCYGCPAVSDMGAHMHHERSTKSLSATVSIIDDDPVFRDSIRNLIESAGIEVAAFESAGEFLEKAILCRPGCILLDVSMPDMTGLELQTKLSSLGFHQPIIFMTGNPTVANSVLAMKAGALDFLVKPFKSDCLFTLISQAVERSARLHQQHARNTLERSVIERLTPREAEVFAYVSHGLLNKQIAHEMQISEIMVKLHRSRMMKKLQARSVPDIVRLFDKHVVPAAQN